MNGFVMTRLDDQALKYSRSPAGESAVGCGVWPTGQSRIDAGTSWRLRLICGALVLLLHLLLAVVMLHTRSQPVAQLKSEVVAVRWMAMPQPAAPQKPVESTPPAATQSPPVVEPTAQPTPPDVAPVAQAKPVDKPKPFVRPKPGAKPHPVKALTPRPRVAPAAALAPSSPPVMAAKAKPAAAEPVHEAQYQSASLRNPAPSYPPLSRRFGEEGRVVLRVLVSSAGEALTVELLTSSGHPRLDEAARKMVATWRFIPAQRGQETLQTWLRVPVVFQLRR